MKSPALVLHKAIIQRIEYMTSYKVFDATPENEAFPYVTMGNISASDWSDKFENGQEVYATIHIWSQYRGRKEADEMADVILRAMTSMSLDLTPDFRAGLDKFDSYNLIMDIDGVTRHGLLKFKYLVEEL